MAQQLAIETRRLMKQFDRHLAVNDIDLQVAAAEVCGLMTLGRIIIIHELLLLLLDEPISGLDSRVITEILHYSQEAFYEQAFRPVPQRVNFLVEQAEKPVADMAEDVSYN